MAKADGLTAAGPGTGGHRARSHRAAGRQHRGPDDQQLAPPSFAGRFLPSEREVKKTGFSAQWRLSSLATTAQADIANGKRICLGADEGSDYAHSGATPGDCADSFSVAFIDPVNPYSPVGPRHPSTACCSSPSPSWPWACLS